MADISVKICVQMFSFYPYRLYWPWHPFDHACLGLGLHINHVLQNGVLFYVVHK
uniref:Predicted protein n=1 Tax=Hordeum vulgare subsp. vulgare TaxID=112509 RepID=F2D8L1_HORVV|nr:predicted protein [Hordeum vulgare subsp. vulgare]